MIEKEDLQKIKEIKIIDVCMDSNIPLSGSNRYFKCKEHDSLVIDTQLNVFHWNSRQIINGDVITFVESYFGLSFLDSVNFLSSNSLNKYRSINKEKKTPIKKEFKLKNVLIADNNRRIFAYLMRTRQLSLNTVQFFFDRNYIRQNTHNNLVVYVIHNKYFVCKSADIVGAFAYKTYSDPRIRFFYMYEGTLNLGTFVPYSKTIERIFYFESFIDLMSFHQLYHYDHTDNNYAYIAMHGLKQRCFDYYYKQYPNAEHHIAVDNDSGGNKFFDYLTNTYGRHLPRHIPTQGKDWNEFIKTRN